MPRPASTKNPLIHPPTHLYRLTHNAPRTPIAAAAAAATNMCFMERPAECDQLILQVISLTLASFGLQWADGGWVLSEHLPKLRQMVNDTMADRYTQLDLKHKRLFPFCLLSC